MQVIDTFRFPMYIYATFLLRKSKWNCILRFKHEGEKFPFLFLIHCLPFSLLTSSSVYTSCKGLIGFSLASILLCFSIASDLVSPHHSASSSWMISSMKCQKQLVNWSGYFINWTAKQTYDFSLGYILKSCQSKWMSHNVPTTTKFITVSLWIE